MIELPRRQLLATALLGIPLLGIGLVEAQGRQASPSGWARLVQRLVKLEDLINHHADAANPQARADGYRCLIRLLNLATEWRLEAADPQHPRFVDLSSQVRKFLGDNPDQSYRAITLDRSLSYEIRGTTTQARFIEIGAYVGNFGGSPGSRRLLASVTESGLITNREGQFTLRPGDSPGRLPLPEGTGTYQLLVRTWFDSLERRMAHPPPAIRVLGAVPRPRPISEERIVEALWEAIRLVEDSLGWYSNFVRQAARNGTTNRFMPLSRRRDMQMPTSVSYQQCVWRLEEGQSLAVEFKAPAIPGYWSLVVYNQWGESGNWPFEPTVINNRQATADASGWIRIMLGPEPPSHGYWLSTGGNLSGTLSFRWTRFPHQPPVLHTRLF